MILHHMAKQFLEFAVWDLLLNFVMNTFYENNQIYYPRQKKKIPHTGSSLLALLMKSRLFADVGKDTAIDV